MEYVNRKYTITKDLDAKIEAAVEHMGGTVSPSFFVGLALTEYFDRQGTPPPADSGRDRVTL